MLPIYGRAAALARPDRRRALPCRTIGITQRANSALAAAVDERFVIGETAESFVAIFMALQALIGGVLAARDSWPLADLLLPSLAALPQVIADTAEAND